MTNQAQELTDLIASIEASWQNVLDAVQSEDTVEIMAAEAIYKARAVVNLRRLTRALKEAIVLSQGWIYEGELLVERSTGDDLTYRDATRLHDRGQQAIVAGRLLQSTLEDEINHED